MKFEAVFLDRDGVLNQDRADYVKTPDELVMIAGSAKAVRRLNAAGLPVVVVTNQSGVAYGRYTEDDLAAIHRRLADELAVFGAQVGGIYYCPHRAEDACDCRKPLPGMLLHAAAEHGFDPRRAVLVGDAARDLEAAGACGAARVLVRTGQGAQHEAKLAGSAAPPDYVAADLVAAVGWILAQ